MTTAPLTERSLLEIAEHEGLVLEMYLDGVGEPTWGFGVTDASGHKVGRYLKKRSTIERAVEVFEWLLRTKYLPQVRAAFKGRELTEAQLTAALSFHWNTGAIGQADWVQSFLLGRREKAWTEFLHWSRPREIISRRKAERALFFDGRWSGDGVVLMYERVRADGTPDWKSARQIDIRDEVRVALTRAQAGQI